jgi:hypothetical protein
MRRGAEAPAGAPLPARIEVLGVADGQDPGGSDSRTNLSAWFALIYTGARWRGLGRVRRLRSSESLRDGRGGAAPKGHGFPPGRRMADGRMAELGAVWAERYGI